MEWTPPEPDPTGPAKVAKDNNSREAEATAEFVRNPGTFNHIVCRVCDRTFATTTESGIKVCSDRCRARELLDIGIVWDVSKPPEERWAPKPVPLVVPPEAYPLAMELVLSSPVDSIQPQPEPTQSEYTDIQYQEDGLSSQEVQVPIPDNELEFDFEFQSYQSI